MHWWRVTTIRGSVTDVASLPARLAYREEMREFNVEKIAIVKAGDIFEAIARAIELTK
jgi:hypothetical protein